MEKTFTETQRFTQWWLWLILIGTASLPLVNHFFSSNAVQSTLQIDILVVSFIAFCFAALFYFMSLKSEINAAGIKMKFIPFVKKSLKWDQIESIRLLNYGFVGGWGIRVWTDYGTVYNTKGQIGLAITTIEGQRFVIGTQQPERLAQVISTIKVAKFTNELTA